MKNISTKSSDTVRQFDPLNNFLFYKVMGEKGDEVQLLGFINAVLGKTENDKFTSVEIMENKSFMAEIINGKSCILDVRAQLKNGAMIDIEVQLQNQHNMDRRSLYYLGKEYTRGLKSGQDYIDLPSVIAINIVDFDFPQASNFHSSFHLREDTEREIILTNALEIHFINMVKYRKQIKDRLCDPLCRWLAWLDRHSPQDILKEVIKMDTAIQTAEERFAHIINMDEEELLAYDRYVKTQCDITSMKNSARRDGLEEGRIAGLQEGRIKGLQEGLEKGREEVLEFIKMGLSLEEIQQRLRQ